MRGGPAMRPRPRRKSDGRSRAMTPIGEALRKWLNEARVAERAGVAAALGGRGAASSRAQAAAKPGSSIFDAWSKIVGEEVARRTRVIDCRGGELIVEVSSAPLLNELSTYYSEQILESLHGVEEFRTVHKLRFRAGSFT